MNILRVDVPSSSVKPHSTHSGRYLVRAGTQMAAIHPEKMLSILLDQERNKFVEHFRSIASEIEVRLDQTLNKVDDVIGNITGGNAVPKVATNVLGAWHLQNTSSNYPLFDVKVHVSEYWLPQAGEKLPDGFWQDIGNTSDIPKNRILSEVTVEKVLPGRSVSLNVAPNFKRHEVLFPQTGKAMFRAVISARSCVYTQLISFKAYEYQHSPDPFWLSSYVLLDANQNIIEQDGEARWGKRNLLLKSIRNDYKNDGVLLPIWPEKLSHGPVAYPP